MSYIIQADTPQIDNMCFLLCAIQQCKQAGLLLLLLSVLLGAKFHQIVKNKNKREYSVTILSFSLKSCKIWKKNRYFLLTIGL